MEDYTLNIPKKPWHKGMIPIFSFTFEQERKRIKAGLGIDLAKYKEDIRMIFYKRQAQRILRKGLDPEEVLQEVYKGILIRNKGKCPYNPSKSAFSTYVVLVMDCVVMNLMNRNKRDKERFEFGIEDDVATSCDSSFTEDPTGNILMKEIRTSLKSEQLQVFDAIMDGFKLTHIARMFEWETKKVTKIKKEIQRAVALKMNRKDLIKC